MPRFRTRSGVRAPSGFGLFVCPVIYESQGWLFLCIMGHVTLHLRSQFRMVLMKDSIVIRSTLDRRMIQTRRLHELQAGGSGAVFVVSEMSNTPINNIRV